MKYDSEGNNMTGFPWYVTMTDKFLSGWGRSHNKINKLVFGCNSLEEAEIVAENASNRSDQKYINIVNSPPTYNKNKYFVQFKDVNKYGNWYKKGAF